MAWLLYQLDNCETWTPEGTFDFATLTDLDNFCRRTGKWSEVPYIQGFWALRSRPDLCAQCSTAQVLLAQGNSQPERPPKPTAPEPLSSFSDSPEDLASPPPPPPPPYQLPWTATPAPALPSQPDSSPPSEDLSSPVSSHTHSCLNLEPLDSHICPLWEVVGAEDVIRVHVSFSLTDLSSIEKCLGSFSTNPTNFIRVPIPSPGL